MLQYREIDLESFSLRLCQSSPHKMSWMSNDWKNLWVYFFLGQAQKKRKKSRSPTRFVGQTVSNLTWKVEWTGRRRNILKKASFWRPLGLSSILQDAMKWTISVWTVDDGTVMGGALTSYIFLLHLFGGFVFDEYAFNSERGITTTWYHACGKIYAWVLLTLLQSYITRGELKRLRNKQPTPPCLKEAHHNI